MKCKNCNNSVSGKFCSLCGQEVYANGLNFQFILNEFLGAYINYDQGVLKTLKLLFTLPDKVLKPYINGNTKSFYSPFKLFFVGFTLFIITAELSYKTDVQNSNTSGQYFVLVSLLLSIPIRSFILKSVGGLNISFAQAFLIFLYYVSICLIVNSVIFIIIYFLPEIMVIKLPWIINFLILNYWIYKLNNKVVNSIFLSLFIYLVPEIVLAPIIVLIMLSFL